METGSSDGSRSSTPTLELRQLCDKHNEALQALEALERLLPPAAPSVSPLHMIAQGTAIDSRAMTQRPAFYHGRSFVSPISFDSSELERAFFSSSKEQGEADEDTKTPEKSAALATFASCLTHITANGCQT